jgi:hypothetical protein
MHVMIGGIPREVTLTLFDCNAILKRWNQWYAVHVIRLKARHENEYLPRIHGEQDPDKKAELIQLYQAIVDRDFVNIEVPFAFIITAIWRILTKAERRRFKNRVFPTRNKTAKQRLFRALLRDEYAPLAHFVGEQLLNMPGYKKKL